MSLLVNSAATHYLSCAKERLTLGETTLGTRMARAALAYPGFSRDTHLRAKALLVLVQACILESHFRLAYALSWRARALFAAHSDPQGQAEASAALSYSASALGRNDEALDASRDAIAFSSHVDSPVTQAFGLNYSGVAAFWARDFGTSRAVLETSAWYVTRHSSASDASFQPLVNLAFCEVLQLLDPKDEDRASQDYSELIRVLARASALQEAGCAGFLNKATGEVGLVILDFARCFLASRLGIHELADERYLSCLTRLSHVPRVGWLHALVWWGRLERARARGKLASSLACAAAMRQAARAGAHQQLVAIAADLEAQLRKYLGGIAT